MAQCPRCKKNTLTVKREDTAHERHTHYTISSCSSCGYWKSDSKYTGRGKISTINDTKEV